MRAIAVVLLALGVACAPSATTTPTAEVATSTSVEANTSTKPTSTTIVPVSTTQPSHRVGLYRVDPGTLTPIPGTEPLTTGDWISGQLSPNGEWLAVHVWIETEPETDLVQVIETATGEIVTEMQGRLSNVSAVSDDGVVVQTSHLPYSGSRIRTLARGASRYETAFDDFPFAFSVWGPTMILDRRRAAWLGTSGTHLEASTAGMFVVDLPSGETTTHMLEDVTLGAVSETDVGDWPLSEMVEPAVVWDEPRNRALFVHGNEDKVTKLDVTTGGTSTHEWPAAISWLDNLFAWLIPPAQAKGPSEYGVERSASLSRSGELLYVATSVSEVVIESEGDWFIESTPQGVEAIDTETWEVRHRWEIPASEVSLSPDGRYLVAIGTTWTDSLSTSDVRSEGVFVIDTDSQEVIGRFDPPDPWPELQFPPDGNYLYVGTCCGDGSIHIVDLATMEVVGSSYGTLIGGSVLVTTLRS